jgi:hypothetical protein
MKKTYCLILLLFASTLTYCQIDLNNSDLNKLIEIGEYYSKNVMLTEKSAIEDLEKLRTDKLNNIINVLQIQSTQSIDILNKKYLNRPSYDDLVMWYVIREIHYNLTDKENEPRTSVDVAKEFLSKKIDERWLLDNYYYRLFVAVGMIFNKTDLSKYNIELDNYGLQSNTEKAIVYLNLMDALGTRFKVLQMLKKNEKIIEFSSRMPKFNGKEYFYFNDFGYEDFKWIGHKKIEMFNERHIGLLYEIILAHMNAEAYLNGKKGALEIYQNSLMTKPQYFKYSSSESELIKLYKRINKDR